MTTHAGTTSRPAAPGALENFAANGFAVLPGALRPEEVDALRAEAAALCRGERGELTSPEPLLPPADGPESAEDTIRRFLCVHHPHKASDHFRATMAHPLILDALRSVIGPDIKSMQSMLFIKSEGKPGQAWHQDEYFIPTRDRSLTAAWIALDDATVENGCLWVLPGSHQPGVIHPTHEQDDPRFDCTEEAYSFPYRDEDAVPVEVAAGSVVMFHGHLLHRSLPNTAAGGFRRALVNHYMSASSQLPWGERPEGDRAGSHDYRDIVMVSGTDPYAWKGLEERARMYVRPSGDGGCDR